MLTIENINYRGPCIYCIWNTEDDRMYFGMAKNYAQRAMQHRSSLRLKKHDNGYLQNNYNKDLELIIAPIELCKEGELCEREQFWIEFFSTYVRVNGFNLTTGGDGGYKRTPEVLEKMANTRRGNPGSLKGRPQTEEHKLARSLATKGIPRPMSEKALKAVRQARAKLKGTFQKGKGINVFNLSTGEAIYFESMMGAERLLGLTRNTIAGSFESRRIKNKKPKRNMNIMLYKNYLIEKAV